MQQPNGCHLAANLDIFIIHTIGTLFLMNIVFKLQLQKNCTPPNNNKLDPLINFFKMPIKVNSLGQTAET